MDINERAREALLAEVTNLTDVEINHMPKDNRWSIRQIIEHLYLMEASVAHTINNQLNEHEDVVEDKPIHLTVDRTTKVEAPSFLEPGNDFISLSQLVSKLEESHKALVRITENIPEVELSKRTYPHPVFGSMNLKQWIPFVGYHEMRHIEQLKEVKTELAL